jgi:maleamate amidohydrolase
MVKWQDLVRQYRGELPGKSWAPKGKKPAVVVVDMTRAFLDERYPLANPEANKGCVASISSLLLLARSKSIPIFYIKGKTGSIAERGRWKLAEKINRVMIEDGEAHQIVPELAPQAQDIVVAKNKPSAFFGTDLASVLNYYGVDTLIICGVVTSVCVRGTVVDAFCNNYRVIVPEECVADPWPLSHEVALFEFHMRFADVVPLKMVQKYLQKLGG